MKQWIVYIAELFAISLVAATPVAPDYKVEQNELPTENREIDDDGRNDIPDKFIGSYGADGDTMQRYHSEAAGDVQGAASRPVDDTRWRTPRDLGQISGIAVDMTGKPVIFHRGDRTWNYGTFDSQFRLANPVTEPIREDTVLTLDPETGDILIGWGGNIFYMPHGIHIDSENNVWLTDVALHQVFKFIKSNDSHSMIADLILGERFVPGNDVDHFCQPTAVAVGPSGEIVVADGYCNDRIIVFDSTGLYVNAVPSPTENGFLRFNVPHGLTIRKRGDVCVADRENSRIVCLMLEDPKTESTKDRESSHLPFIVRWPGGGEKIFGVASHDNLIYAINGPSPCKIYPLLGWTMEPYEGRIQTWGPQNGAFTNPHAIAVSPNGTSLYVSEIGPNRVWKFNIPERTTGI